MCLWVSYKKKYEKIKNFAYLKPLKKGVGSGVGSGSVSQRYGFLGSGSAPKCHGSLSMIFVYMKEKLNDPQYDRLENAPPRVPGTFCC
jgi:hypothetical protein